MSRRLSLVGRRPRRAPRALVVLTVALLSAVGCKPKDGAGASAVGPGGADSADVPFQLRLEPFTIEGLVGLHSGAHAAHDGKLVLLAGRRNGMHAFPPQRGEGAQIWSFPPEEANDVVYVVDLAARRLLGSGSVNALPAKIANQLRATNVQYFTRDGRLFVVGGYALTPDRSSMKTSIRSWPSISRR